MTVLTDAFVRGLAGGRAYARGTEYYRAGRVESLVDNDGEISATVNGTQAYSVTLTAGSNTIDFDCDCPQGDDGSFCKHCVAAALAWLNGDSAKSRKAPKQRKLTVDDAVGFLAGEDKETIVRMVAGWAREDRWLQERLLHYAARKSGPETAVAAAKQAFDRAVRVHGYIDYREASGWADGVSDAIEGIAELLEDGHAKEVVELCEHALRRLESAVGGIDDSDGHLAGLCERLQDLHLSACEEARPDPVDLARRLLHLELRSELGAFHGALKYYQPVLGEEGIAEYKRLADAEWAKVPVRNQRGTGESYYRITSIMQSLAKASGEIEMQVSIMSRDLSSPYNYLNIAQTYRDAGDQDKALEWAEKGLKAFPQRTDWRLRDFAANLYHSRGRHDDAMQLVWTEFRERVCFETYLNLQGHAEKAGTWTEWRDLAIAEMRSRSAKAPRTDRSLLVQIFIHEKDLEAAWREAQAGGCSDALWRALASTREDDHPEDAAPIYLKYADQFVKNGAGDYSHAVELLIKAAILMKRMNRSEEFAGVLANMRATYKIKRNFIKLLEEKRSSLCP